MSDSVSLKCKCGNVRGEAFDLSTKNTNHTACHCRDCQSFGRFFGGEPLDAYSGTTIVQMSPAQVKILEGNDLIKCLRLTEKGMIRWYTDCCKTPIGNTPASAGLPFVGMIHSFIDLSDEERVARFGPVLHSFTKNATGSEEGIASLPKGGVGIIFKMIGFFASWKLKGDGKRSPFFDPETGDPVKTPHVLSAEELGRLQ